MIAWMNAESIQKTLTSGEAHSLLSLSWHSDTEEEVNLYAEVTPFPPEDYLFSGGLKSDR